MIAPSVYSKLDLMRQLQGKSGFADSAGAGECQEPRVESEPRNLGKLALPADKWGRFDRKCVPPPARPQRGGCHERRQPGRTQVERRRQAAGCVGMWVPAGTAFQIRNSTTAQACALAQRFLREASSRPIVAKLTTEALFPACRLHFVELHDSKIVGARHLRRRTGGSRIFHHGFCHRKARGA